MTSLRRSLPALVGLMFAGVVAVVGAGPASAQPYPVGSQATALLPGTPLIQVNCPVVMPAQVVTSDATNGVVTVTDATVQCSGNAAQTNGTYSVGGFAPTPPTGTSGFSAQCVNNTSFTNGLVFVPAGTTNVATGAALDPRIPVTETTTVRFPNGSVAVLNEVVTTPTSVTRTAIRIISGPGAGTIVGQVVCGAAAAYPLAVDSPSAAAPADVALTAVSGDEGGSSDNRMLLVGGAIALLILAQVAVGRSVVRRRRDVTGS